MASVALGCSESTPPLVPTTLVAAVQSITFDAIGATQAVSVVVKDQNGGTMQEVAVTWTSNAPAVVAVGPGSAPTVTASGEGIAILTATAGKAQAAIQVTVTQLPVAPVKLAGDLQSGTVGVELGTQLTVRVQDRLGNPMAGRNVVFTPAASSGGAIPSTVASGLNGAATVRWTLGALAGQQAMAATIAGVAAAATFTATAAAGPPASIAVNAGNAQTAVAGSAVAIAPAAKVTDTFNNPVPGATVTFSASALDGTVTGGTATTDASGVATVGSWTLGTSAGTKTLSASVPGVAAASFTATAVAGPPAGVIVAAGNNQTAQISTPVSVPPAVRVSDINGNAVAGVSVNFAVASGGGSATGTGGTTNATGIAAVGTWTLGPAVGTNTLTATVAASGISGNPVTFTATGATTVTAGFNIELRYLTTPSASQLAAFTAAVARWQTVITGDLPSVASNVGAGTCGSNSPALNETIDDVIIFVTLEAIDGPGGILGSAGPCYIRQSNGLTTVGRMRFDIADMATLEAQGQLNPVILHEMGHVLGIGSLWSVNGFFSLLANPSLPSSPGADTRFTGVNGIAGFDLVGGATYTGGGKVPVENTQGGSGTRDSHWRENVLANELMTGFLNSGANPMSMLTVRSLQDLGYTVNTAQAEAFFVNLTAAALSEPGPRVELRNDVNYDVLYVVDPLGRIVRTIRPQER